jgi:MFS family permease
VTESQPLDRRAIARWTRAVLVVFVLMGLGFGTWLSRLPAVRDHLGATTVEMSVYGLCLAVGSVAGLLVSGHTVQWLGPRRTLAVTVGVQALALPGAVAVILGGWIPLGLAVLFAYGFAFSTADVAMNVSGANGERALGRPRLPLMHAGYSLGAVGAMGLGALAEVAGLPVQLHFVLVFVAIVLATAAVLPLLPRDEQGAREAAERGRPGAERGGEPRPGPVDSTGPIPVVESAGRVEPAIAAATGSLSLVPPAEPEGGPAQTADPPAPGRGYSPWRDPRILVIGLIALAAGILEGTPSDWLPLALVDGRGFTNEAGALMLGVFFASVMAVRLAGSVVLQRFGRVATLRAGAALSAAGVLTVILAPGTVPAVLGTVAWGLGVGLGWPVAIAAAADRPETAVRGVAAVSALGYASMLIGPMGFGFLGEHIGLLNAFWALLPFAALSGLLAHAAREPRHTRSG